MSDTAIQNAMEAARLFLNSTEERRQYINREMARMDYESRFQQGIKQGAEQEANRYNKLMQILMSKGDMETIQEVIKDNTKRIELYKEYHLV